MTAAARQRERDRLRERMSARRRGEHTQDDLWERRLRAAQERERAAEAARQAERDRWLEDHAEEAETAAERGRWTDLPDDWREEARRTLEAAEREQAAALEAEAWDDEPEPWGLAALDFPRDGYGIEGREHRPRPTRLQPGPLRPTGQLCAEPGCENVVEGHRKTKLYCPVHSTPAAKQRRYRKSAPKSRKD